MHIVENPVQMQEIASSLRKDGKKIALVSTSGALNKGHLSLVKAAKKAADTVILTAFVNPVEFGPNEDFQKYPRNSSGDAEFCEHAKVDILFRPGNKDLYPDGFSCSVAEEEVSAGLCGVSRPHYFRGVCTLHVILLNLIRPDILMQGWRDAQKCAVLKKLLMQLHYQVDIKVVDTVREESGLAYNARNSFLNDFQRKDAATLYKSLLEGKKLADSGITNVDRILAEVTHHISQVRRLRVIYVAAVDPDTIKPIRSQIIQGKTLIMTAIWCDEVRLIDNILL